MEEDFRHAVSILDGPIVSCILREILYTELQGDKPSMPLLLAAYVPSKDFRWVTADRKRVATYSFDTTHLFHTAKMVWNHTVKPGWRIVPFNARTPSRLTIEFAWAPAFKELIFALAARHLTEPLPEYAVKDLHFMLECLCGAATNYETHYA